MLILVEINVTTNVIPLVSQELVEVSVRSKGAQNLVKEVAIHLVIPTVCHPLVREAVGQVVVRNVLLIAIPLVEHIPVAVEIAHQLVERVVPPLVMVPVAAVHVVQPASLIVRMAHVVDTVLPMTVEAVVQKDAMLHASLEVIVPVVVLPLVPVHHVLRYAPQIVARIVQEDA